MNYAAHFNWNVLLLLSFAHAITDLSQGAIPVLLPFLKEKFILTYTQVGLIILVSNLTSSLTQPLFGYLSDRSSTKWLMPIGCLLSALGVGLAGIAPSFWSLLLVIGLSGIGVAAFHPEGSKYTHYASGLKKASGMSIFSVGGNLGYASGAILITSLLLVGSLVNTLYLAIPGLLVSLILWSSLARIAAGPLEKTATNLPGHAATRLQWKDQLPSLGILLAFIIFRSWIQSGLGTYIPLYYINYLHKDPLYASTLLSLFLLAGGIGTFLGGPISDRFGQKTILTGSMLITLPLMFVFPYTSGALALIILIIIGVVLVSSFSTTVVLGQQILPNNIGIASGLVLGFTFGLGGIGVLLLGTVADHWGISSVFKVLTVFNLLALFLTLFISGKLSAKIALDH